MTTQDHDHQPADTIGTELVQPSGLPVRVFVVEDEDSARERLCATLLLDDRLRLCGQAGTFASARRWLADSRHSLDVLLVDLGLPDGSGLDLISECAQLRPNVAVMVMTLFGDERHVFTALERGATGYLLKSTPAEALAEHILDLHAGGSPITPTVARLVIKRMGSKASDTETAAPEVSPEVSPEISAEAPPSSNGELSARELDVLNQIAVGYNTVEIAEQLSISPHTVTSHIRHVYQKLQVRSRSAAVYEGQRRGLISHLQ